jgi:excisionase family DNA binding protein
MAGHDLSLQFLSVASAAREMHVGVRRLNKAIAAGQIPSIKLGQRRVIARAALLKLAQQKKAPQ